MTEQHTIAAILTALIPILGTFIWAVCRSRKEICGFLAYVATIVAVRTTKDKEEKNLIKALFRMFKKDE